MWRFSPFLIIFGDFLGGLGIGVCSRRFGCHMQTGPECGIFFPFVMIFQDFWEIQGSGHVGG